MRKFLLFFLIVVFSSTSKAQQTPFSKGINLTNWFQYGDAQQIPFTRYRKKDFAQIKSLGCDVIRLPINLHSMTLGDAEHTLDPLFLMFLDSAVSWAEELNLHLILDNHTFDPAVSTDPAVEEILVKVWKQMALHYRDRSDKIYYEVLNEPHGISDAIWGDIQGRVIDTIRSVDSKHTIIIGGAGWNSYNNLQYLPFYADTNLIYTFHFYDPFLFTHQGASWVGPSLEPLAGMPFPFRAADMPVLPSAFQGTWIESTYNNYANEASLSHLEQQMNKAVQFRQARNVPVFCGEFGTYIPNSNSDDRVNWYEAIRSMMDSMGISWTSWDYHGGFGVFLPETEGLFDHHLNIPLVQALGFNAPPQGPLIIQPDTAGFFVYRDYVEEGIREAHASDGPISFFGNNNPNYGTYHISWKDGGQYSSVRFNYFPDKDLSLLTVGGFALDFFVRPGEGTRNLSLDVRFLDSNTTDPSDLPWRMRHSFETGTGSWLHYHIPLTDFVEHGSWYDNTWHEPEGLFDWSEVDRLEFVAENGPFAGEISFDHVQLTELDTARVNASTSVVGEERPIAIVYPNPFIDEINLSLVDEVPYEVAVRGSLGKLIWQGRVRQAKNIPLPGLSPGLYLISLRNPSGKITSYRLWKE